MVAPIVTLATGEIVHPGYKLLKHLGRGGWGEVWKAVDQDGQYRALKFLPCSSQQVAHKEIRGLQSIRQLKHPYITDIEQVWADSGYIVIAMALAEGTLTDLFEVYYQEYNAPPVAKVLLPFFEQVASALDFLNSRQHVINGRRVAVRHCDIKPSNLLIFDQTLKVADFSLAVQTSSPMWYHERVGTMNFAAPEVLRGWLSDRSDQYSLAVSYFQMRTGNLPYPPISKKQPDFYRNYVRPAPELSELETKAEQDVVGRALNPTPHDRWPSCEDFINELKSACNVQ